MLGLDGDLKRCLITDNGSLVFLSSRLTKDLYHLKVASPASAMKGRIAGPIRKFHVRSLDAKVSHYARVAKEGSIANRRGAEDILQVFVSSLLAQELDYLKMTFEGSHV